MLVVRYGQTYKSEREAEQVADDIRTHKDAPEGLIFEITERDDSQYLLLPRMTDADDNVGHVKQKPMKRWVYQRLKEHSIQGKSAQHSAIGKLHQLLHLSVCCVAALVSLSNARPQLCVPIAGAAVSALCRVCACCHQ